MSAAAGSVKVGEAKTIDEKITLITRNLQEVMGGGEGKETIEQMRKILSSGRDLKVYWGTATTGAPHIGYFVPMSKMADFLRAGCHVTILFADLHAYLDNMKSSWELLGFRVEYYEHVIKAMLESIGVPIDKLKFVRGTSYQLSREYTLDVYKLTSLVTERNAKKAGAEVVKQVASPLLSGLLYPLLQALDEQYLDVDIQFGGVDQRKIFTFAEETLPKIGYAKRMHLMNPMVPGLQGPKMSSSEKGSKLDLLEPEASIMAKVSKAYAKEGEVADNGLLAFCKMVLFALNQNPNGLTFEREAKYGGDLVFKTYADLEAAYVAKKLYPLDLKHGVAKLINGLLAPIRQKFTDPKLVELIAKAYPPNSETFHQAGGPAATEANSTGVTEDKDSDDDKPSKPTAAAAAATAAAAAPAKDSKSNDSKKAGGGDSKKAGGGKAGKGGASGGGGGGGKKAEGAAVLDVRVGQIVKVDKHPKGDHLLQLEVSIGEAKARHVTCGGGKVLSAADLKDKKVPVVINIKKTEGLIFIAQSADGKTVEVVEAPAEAKIGDRVLEKGTAAADDYAPQRDDLRKELWATVTIGAASELIFGGGKAFSAGGKPCVAKTIKNGKLLG